MTYFVRPVSAFLASQTSPFPNWSFQTMHPYWTWPRDGSLPVLEGLIQFTEGSEGPPGMAHGGCVATALDSVATCLVNSMFSRMHMPQEPKPGDPVFEHPGYRTVSLTVGYSKGTPVGSTFYYRILVEKADDGKGKDGKLQLRRKLRIKGGIYERILAEGESDASAKPALVADFDGVFVLGGAVPLNVFEESWKVLESEGRAKAKL